MQWEQAMLSCSSSHGPPHTFDTPSQVSRALSRDPYSDADENSFQVEVKSQTGWSWLPGNCFVQIYELNEENQHEVACQREGRSSVYG